MSTLRTTSIIHGSSAVDNIVLDNQGRALFGPNSPAGRAALYVNAQLNRVGVNTESPSVELDVDGQISATSNATIGGTLDVTGRVSVTGNLGVGTSSPTYNFEVVGGSSAAKIGSASQALYFAPDSNGVGLHVASGQTNAGIYFNATSDNLWLQTDATTRLAIDIDGRVGIGGGTVQPRAQLYIVRPLDDSLPVFACGETSASDRFRIYQESSYTGIRLDTNNVDFKLQSTLAAGTGGNIIFNTGIGAGNAAEIARFNSEGNFGINDTDPSAKLVIKISSTAVYPSQAPSITDCVSALTNVLTSETAGAHASMQFNVAGPAYNRVCAIGAYAESAGNRYSNLYFATDDAGARRTKAIITGRGDFNMAPNTGANGQLVGGFGAVTTAGVLSWNDPINARSGNGYTLLTGGAAGGPGGTFYFHCFNFEYSAKGGTGNLAQWAIGYNTNERYMRTRFSGAWSSWVAF